jgi:hypothetical protein
MRAKSWSDFWNCVEVGESDKCWPWKLYCDPRGYGRVKRKKKNYSAHRIAYQLHYLNGRQLRLEGLNVCHKCDNPPCCNPSHLFLGTQKKNLDDAITKGRLFSLPPRKGSENGRAKLTDSDVAEIRAAYEPRYGALTELSKRFGVSRGVIWKVVNNRSWKHV